MSAAFESTAFQAGAFEAVAPVTGACASVQAIQFDLSAGSESFYAIVASAQAIQADAAVGAIPVTSQHGGGVIFVFEEERSPEPELEPAQEPEPVFGVVRSSQSVHRQKALGGLAFRGLASSAQAPATASATGFQEDEAELLALIIGLAA